MNNLESSGYNAIMDEVRLTSDPADPWGSNIAWLFGLADFMYAMNGEILPGYRPSPIMVDLQNPGYELETLFSLYAHINDEDVVKAYYVLARRDGILRSLDMDY